MGAKNNYLGDFRAPGACTLGEYSSSKVYYN